MAFVPATNIPLGTYVTDGLRSGPSYTNLNSTTVDANNQYITGYYDKFGPGVLYTPYNTWDIVPYNSTVGNIVAATAVVAAGNLTLTQDTFATTKLLGSNNQFYVQFDWPRVPAVVVSGAAMTAATSVTIFGTDWYGFPLQAVYTVQAPGIYPANLGTAAKAFYRITQIYVNGSTGVGGTLQVQTTNIFGLPYAIKEKSYASNFSWAGNSMLSQSGTATLVAGTAAISTPAYVTGANVQTSTLTSATPANIGGLYLTATSNRSGFTITSTNVADTSVVGWFMPNAGQNLVAAADTTPATAITGDVRGLIQLPGLKADGTNETWGPLPDGTRRLVYTPYVFGADQFQNQLAAGGQPQGTGAIPPATNTVPFLTKDDLYGVAQYYTGSV